MIYNGKMMGIVVNFKANLKKTLLLKSRHFSLPFQFMKSTNMACRSFNKYVNKLGDLIYVHKILCINRPHDANTRVKVFKEYFHKNVKIY